MDAHVGRGSTLGSLPVSTAGSARPCPISWRRRRSWVSMDAAGYREEGPRTARFADSPPRSDGSWPRPALYRWTRRGWRPARDARCRPERWAFAASVIDGVFRSSSRAARNIRVMRGKTTCVPRLGVDAVTAGSVTTIGTEARANEMAWRIIQAGRRTQGLSG